MSKKKEKKPNNRTKYIVLGVVITVIVMIIVFVYVLVYNVPENNNRSIEDFNTDLFNQGFDVICENQNCLIRVTEDVKWYHDLDTNTMFFFSKTRDMIMYENSYGVSERKLINELEFNEELYGNSFVMGLPFEEPIILVWKKGIDFPQLPPIPSLNVLPYAHAQIQQYELELREIQDVKDCTKKVVSGASAYIPFTFKIFNDPTEDYKLEIVQQSRSFPITQRTPQVMIFHTNYTDQYNIYFEINYDTARERQVFLQYLSRGALAQTEQEKFDGNKYCMNLIVNTVEAPRIPTREDMFGDAYFYFQQIPTLVEGFNRNSLTTSSSITYQWLVMGIIGVGIILLTIQNAQNKKSFGHKMKEVSELVEFASTREEEALQRHDDLKNVQNEIMKNQGRILENQKQELKVTEPQEEPKEKKSKIDTINPKKLIAKIIKPKSKEEETLEESDLTKLEGKDTKERKERIKKINLEKMDSLTKEVINQINTNEVDANFKDFTYSDLTHALEWINEFIKSSNFMGIPEERRNKQLKIAEMIHAGAIRKYNKENVKK